MKQEKEAENLIGDIMDTLNGEWSLMAQQSMIEQMNWNLLIILFQLFVLTPYLENVSLF